MIADPGNITFTSRAVEHISRSPFLVETKNIEWLLYIPSIIYSYGGLFVDLHGDEKKIPPGYSLTRVSTSDLDNATIVHIDGKKPIAICFESGFSKEADYLVDFVDGEIVIMDKRLRFGREVREN